jgi:hypothetical protein
MLKTFLKEEGGEGSADSLLLVGGTVIMAIILASLYSTMATSTVTTINKSVANATEVLGQEMVDLIRG